MFYVKLVVEFTINAGYNTIVIVNQVHRFICFLVYHNRFVCDLIVSEVWSNVENLGFFKNSMFSGAAVIYRGCLDLFIFFCSKITSRLIA